MALCSVITKTGLFQPQVPLTIEDIKLQGRTPRGAIVVEDCSCDSKYMLKAMVQVEKVMREGYHWIPFVQPIYLNLDNDGDHDMVWMML